MTTRFKPTSLFSRVVFLLLLLVIFVSASNNLTAYATNGETSDSLRYYIGDTKDARVNTGKDNGYSGSEEIGLKDPHYGWKIGRFFVSGYTRASEDANQNPVLIKTLGDKVTLWFNLEQDIGELNGNSKLTISEDKNGYDKYFEIAKTNFGHGTLIIRHTDWQNKAGEPTIYTDYLVAKAELNADTQIELFEEGDYEIALDYEIRKDNFPFPDSYTNYRIFFRFSVRNGNCMVYPFDAKTRGELTNSSMTENGFYLDLAKSRYLDIDIKKEVLSESADGLTTDTRFNRPAKDGDQYTEEGIYTLTVSNRYTGEKTTKRVYVGTNNVLKAHLTTGLPIKEINTQISLGAQIKNDGTIVFPPSNVEIIIIDGYHNPLAGGVFIVHKADGASIGGEYTTGIDGKAIIPSLAPGSYVISVVKAPENYMINEQSQSVDVKSDREATLTFTGIEFPSLNICAVDPESGEYIAGVKFSITDGDNAIIEELETLSSGAAVSKPVRPGSYTITGTHDANGVAMSEAAKFTIEVREDGIVYYDNTVLADNTLIFQAKGAQTPEETEMATPDESAAVFVKTEADERVKFPVAFVIIVVVIVVVLATAAFFIVRRRSAKASIAIGADVPVHTDMEDDDK